MTTTPEPPRRVQAVRGPDRGLVVPDGAVLVIGRPFGRPWRAAALVEAGKADTLETARAMIVAKYGRWLADDGAWLKDARKRARHARRALHDLPGRDVACVCPAGVPGCHGDLLLAVANPDLDPGSLATDLTGIDLMRIRVAAERERARRAAKITQEVQA